MINPESFGGHVQLALSIVVPLGSGIIWLIRGQITAAAAQARMELKVDTMWEWFTNHGHELTGYKPGDELRKK